jgi:oxygen-dependent protoporphyrinogen oxidase
MASETVLIVGGGLSGLSTAYYLSKYGIRSVIVEKSGRLGGLIKTDQLEGCQLEAGPDSYISTKPQISDLASELDGLSAKIIGSNDKARRVFVVRNGQLLAMPKGMAMMVPGEWPPVLRSNLLSASTKLRLLWETRTSPRSRDEDFSVGDLVRDHFGTEMLEYLTEPLLCGVYGGDASELSARSVLPRFVGYEQKFGSLIKGVRATAGEKTDGSLFRSFQGGMQTLIDALVKATARSVHVVHSEATRIDQSDTGWRLRFAGESISCSHLVAAGPAHVTANLLEHSGPRVAKELAAIPYSSAIVAMLVFDAAALGHSLNGFGFLVPRRERQTIAAATWVNTKFPSRIRSGLAALRAFVVGEQANQLIAAAVDKEALTQLVLQDFRRLMGISATPLFSTVYIWPKSMPQYVVGHAARINRLQSEADQLPGLHLTGNFFDGVGMPDCIRRAKDVAKHISDHSV